MRGRWLVIFAVAGVCAGPAGAEIFRWTDAQGRLHFAQSLEQVPAPYRKQASGAAASRGRFQTYSSGSGSPASAAPDARTIRVPFEREGALMRVSATLNGHLDVPFYIDTGASGVSIPTAYAERLGIALGPGTDHVAVRTANGVVSVPYVRLDSVRLAGVQVEGLMATVNPTMSVGLLGGSFFNQFNYGVDPAANVITLERNFAAQTDTEQEQYWRGRFESVRKPLEDLETYLRTREISRPERREELERKRTELQARLDELEIEANRFDIPAGWRR